MTKIILGSSSPRRRVLLGSLGVPFEIRDPATEEIRQAGENPHQYVRRNAANKAGAVANWYAQSHPSETLLVIGADTIVSIGDNVYEKPVDLADHKRMLLALSGREHTVTTGVSLVSRSSGKVVEKTFIVTSEVEFKKLSPQEMQFYMGTGEGMDKAGGYALQGKGAFMVKAVRGSYTNVIGLPLAELATVLMEDFNVELFSTQNEEVPW